MDFDCLLMSDSELLRIKNEQKASYKSRKAARSNLKKSFHGLMSDLGLYCPSRQRGNMLKNSKDKVALLGKKCIFAFIISKTPTYEQIHLSHRH